MARDHFANYAKNRPKEYQAFSDSMWNSFVSVTKVVGLGKFFSFSPEKLDIKDYDPELTGTALGEVYNFSQGIDNTPDL
jgi:protein involved in sex pheromone biosynthesis